MKKFVAIAMLGGLVLASCSKKESTYEQDSNTMLPEPEVTVTDTAKAVSNPAATVAPEAPTTEPAKDSTALK